MFNIFHKQVIERIPEGILDRYIHDHILLAAGYCGIFYFVRLAGACSGESLTPSMASTLAATVCSSRSFERAKE
jgi:hypothetical protein